MHIRNSRKPFIVLAYASLFVAVVCLGVMAGLLLDELLPTAPSVPWTRSTRTS